MMIRSFVLSTTLLYLMRGDPLAAQVPPRPPHSRPCKGHGGMPMWRVTLDQLRGEVGLFVDALEVDDCTVYYDLQLVAEFLDSTGKSLGTKRFTDSSEYHGLSEWRLTFRHGVSDAAKVRGKALHSKKRYIGALPGANPDRSLPARSAASDPAIVWQKFADPDFATTIAYPGAQPSCSSSLGRVQGSDACAKLLRDTEREIEEHRGKQYGSPTTSK